MPHYFYIIMFLILSTSASAQDTILIDSGDYFYKEIQHSSRELDTILGSSFNTFRLYREGIDLEKSAYLGIIKSYTVIGAGTVGVYFATKSKGERGILAVRAVSIVTVGLGFLLHRASYKTREMSRAKIKEAVLLYNYGESHKPLTFKMEPYFEISSNDNGLGIFYIF